MDNPFSAKPAAPAAAKPKESAPDAEQEVEVTLPKMGGISHHAVPGDRVSPRSTQMARAPQHQVEAPAEAEAPAPVFEVAEETPDPFGSSEELSSPRVLFAEDKEEQVATETPTPAQASPFAPLSPENAAAPVETPSPAPALPAESTPANPASESTPTPAQPAPAQSAPVGSPEAVGTPVATAPALAVPETAPAAPVPATDQAAPAQQAAPIESAVTPAPVAVETAVAPPLLQEPEIPPAEEKPPATPFGAVEKAAEPPVATAQVESTVAEAVPEKAAPAPAAITPFDEPEPDGPEELINAAPVSESKHMPTRRTRKAGEKAPALTMEEVSCRTCRYLDFDGDHRGEITEGECRRKAPVPGSANEAAWPTVFWDTWCGEWEVGVSDDDMVRMARDVAEGINAKFND